MTARWVAAEPGAQVIGLRWGYSPEKYQYTDFATPEEAAAFAGRDRFVEVVTVRNPGGPEFTFEGRFLADPATVLHLGATVERVWYTIPRVDLAYEDVDAARRDAATLPDPPPYLQEHLRFREPDGRVIVQEGRTLDLDPRWSPVSSRHADAGEHVSPPGR